jgi:hypothetical protein
MPGGGRALLQKSLPLPELSTYMLLVQALSQYPQYIDRQLQMPARRYSQPNRPGSAMRRRQTILVMRNSLGLLSVKYRESDRIRDISCRIATDSH